MQEDFPSQQIVKTLLNLAWKFQFGQARIKYKQYQQVGAIKKRQI
jgi:hypothetical protein